MPDPQKDQVPQQTPVPGSDPNQGTPDPPIGFRSPLFGGVLSGSARELASGQYRGDLDYTFANADRLGSWLQLRTDPAFGVERYGLNGRFGLGEGNSFKFDGSAEPGSSTYRFGSNLQLGEELRLDADWNRTQAGQQYGLDSAFRLGQNGNGTAQFRVDEPNGTSLFNTKLKFNDDFNLNADWQRTPSGQLYGADSAFRLGQNGNGTAQFRVDEPNGTSLFNTKLKFNDDFNLNADWQRTPSGQLYGADSAFRLGQNGNGTAEFRIDEPNGTSLFNTKLKFNDDFNLNADWQRTPNGQLYGADSAFRLGQNGNGTAQFRVDEPNGTSLFNTKLKFNDDFNLNADWQRTPNGQLYGADSAFRLGQNGNGTAQFRVDEPNGTSLFNTKLKFNDDFNLNADWQRTPSGQLYGADSAFRLGQNGNGTAEFRVDEPNGTSLFNTKLKFNDDFNLNADWQRTPNGQLYGADSAFRLGQNGSGTAQFRVDEPNGTSLFNTKLKFDQDFQLNAGWQRTPNGQLYGADSAFRLGQDGSGTAQFRVDEPNGTSLFNTKLKFNDDFNLNADYSSTRDGRVYGADGQFKLGQDGSGTAQFRVDEPNGTSLFNTKLKFNDRFGLNADYTNTKDGAIYGAETTFKLGKDGSGTGGFRVDEPSRTSAFNGKLNFDNGNSVNFDLSKSPNGSVYGAEGSFGIGRDGRGLASFRIDEPNGSSNYKLGASFANGNAFNAQLMADRLGTTLGLDAKVGFDKGAGSVALDGKFGPRAIDLGASLNYSSQNLQYSGVVRANNENGAFRLSEFGAKVSTTGNDRYKFTAEAGYRPDTREAYGKVGLTISFGGGSKPSRPITRADSGFDAGRAFDEPIVAAREKPSVLSRPENKALYEQAVAGVQKLNAEGAKLPVQETAASLTVLAKQHGMREIGYVAMGNPTPDGRQNLFIGDGEPSSPATKQAFFDKAQASGTPMQDSLRRMANEPVQGNSHDAPGQSLPTQEQPVLAAPKRAAS